MTLELTPGPDPNRPPPIRAALERHSQLPQPARVLPVIRWWSTEGLARLGVLLLKAPWLALCEVPYVWVGLGRVVGAWVSWVSVRDAVVTDSEKHSESHARWVEQRRMGRRWLSTILALTLLGFGWWCLVRHPDWLLLVGIVAVCLLDAIGRQSRPKTEAQLPPPHRALLREGVPLSQVAEEIIKIALREGLELGAISPMRHDAVRRQHEMVITCLDQIKPEHLRAFERGIGAAEFTIHAYAPADGEAGVRRLVIKLGDPLANVPVAPYLETGSISISDPIALGVSTSEAPFALAFAGEHIKGVGTTGSGKSAWFLRNAIARVSACHNAVCLGIALTKQQELALWRDVLQRRAYTPEAAGALLDELLAEIELRNDMLTSFAEDDDPENDHLTEWCDELVARTGRPAWVCFIDEFAVFASYDGTGANKELPNLLRKAEQVVRTGRSVWVSLVMLTQKIGNSDFGSKIMQDMANTEIALPCSAEDTVRLWSAELRDQGFTPHLLTPGTKAERHDAGKCFVRAPGMTTPDVYSCFAPLPAGTVKEWARRRIADGLPAMYPAGFEPPEFANEERAHVVHPLLAAMELAFGDDERITTAALIEHLREADEAWAELTSIRLADMLRPLGIRPKALAWPDGRTLRGYARAELTVALNREEL